MKTLILIGVLIVGTFSLLGHANQQINKESHHYREIHTNELKTWYDTNKMMIVVDARSKPYYDGTLLPKAVWLPYDASAKELKKTIPDKKSLIVVYCWNPQCPASQYLVDRLIIEGYTNIYKYVAGLEDWIRQGFPTNKI